MPKLVINSGAAGAVEYELKPGLNTFGRGFNNDFRLDDPSVSAVHAEITVEANCVTVKDLRSTNGTFVNRSQIREGFLQPGQLLSLGVVEMLFVSEAPAQAFGPGDVARTVALPQVGGIKITRPNHPMPAGGFSMPANYPAPFAPAPNLTTTPTPLVPTAAAPAPTARQIQAQSPVPEPVESQPRKYVGAPARGSEASGLRCLGFGLCGAVVSGLVWTLIAALAGINAAPAGLAVTGLICGLAMRFGSGNRSGVAYSLLAVGCALLGMFLGQAGQTITIKTISFANYNVLALLAGVVCAALIGGAKFSAGAAKSTRMV